MKKITLLLFIISNSIFAQNALNSKGEKHGKWSGVYEKTNNLRYEGEFNNGKEVGIFNLYDDTKKKVIISTRDFSRKDGLVSQIFFDQKGNKVSEGFLKNNLKQGKWIVYFKESKQIMSEENYDKGKLNGEAKTYFKNGKILESKFYKNDLLEGNYKRYSEKGHVLHNLNYVANKLNGPGEYYTSSGKIYTKGEYKDNLKVGKWPVFDKNGKEVELERTQKTNPKRALKNNTNKTK